MKFIKHLIPEDMYGVKSPYYMNPIGITIHNTANDAPAINEAKCLQNDPNEERSFHFAVDDCEVVQILPLNRTAWHAGDGHGDGNMRTIAIEICWSKSGGERFEKAEQNAARLLALLSYYKFGRGVREVTYTHQHWSGKYCPHRTLDLGLERFLNMADGFYEEIEKRQNNIISKLAILDDTLQRVTGEMEKYSYFMEETTYWLKRHLIPKNVTPENYGKLAEVINTLYKQGVIVGEGDEVLSMNYDTVRAVVICKRMIDNLMKEVLG
mgnify:CR=1 FL=1